ncbi:hypothetical protein LPB72_09310 [Hydrogenophaga crassostreae]|uniref:Uncharacterized protein n=1 Tax=Hydrogenophaga crassostreae TaxID=1763535 RepID=A0A167I505_9BURK|nr:hypothetical protein [Hydrogenophaga crassostreae]AOW14121.1 hypothetical protein LPB072_16020 [Hydrogenophaga crassostreae]OAD42157.1 hypothetical protein LPB72_09310 [Hydrogenophaga crassostreae]
MSSTLAQVHQLAQECRALALGLFQGLNDPHAELLAMVWGPRFDREHALGLWAGFSRRDPVQALPVLPAMLALADRFDGLSAPVQHRLRRFILKHQSLQVTTV